MARELHAAPHVLLLLAKSFFRNGINLVHMAHKADGKRLFKSLLNDKNS
jgi:hypothetical protein